MIKNQIKPIVITNMEQVFKNRIERDKYTFIIQPDGTSGYLVNGGLMSEEDFDKMLPVNFKRTSNQLDGRQVEY